MYRVAVFFWILIGLVWLSGVISLVTEAVKSRGRSFAEFDKNIVNRMSSRRGTTEGIDSNNDTNNSGNNDNATVAFTTTTGHNRNKLKTTI